MVNFFKEYFNLSNLEQKGVIAFIILIVFVVLIPKFYQIFKVPSVNSNTSFEKWADTFKTEDYKENTYQFENKDLHLETTEKKENKTSPLKLFSFNPNTVNKEGLLALGIKEKTAKTLLNFREKGGKFYKKEDLKIIYGISEEDYKRLENYISIPKDTSFQKQFEPVKKFETATKIRVEINTADSTEFTKLKGIGPVFSSRIVKYREKLGGFYHKNQLMEVYGITDTLYEKIDTLLVLSDSTIRTININTANFKTIIAHPYIDYNTTNSILKYREQNGDFKNIDDLNSLYSLDKKTIAKIKPYLTVHE